MIRTTLLCLAASAFLASCGDKPGAPDAAKTNVDLAQPVGDNVYVNKQFAITVTAPEGWQVADNTVMEKMADAGRDISTAGVEAGAKAQMDAAMGRTISLFSFFKPNPAPNAPPSGVIGVAEDVSIVPGINRGRDYFEQAKATMRLTKVEFREVGAGDIRQIDSVNFDRMDIAISAQGRSATQRYFAARHGKHMVVFIQSYADAAELPELDKVIDSIKLEWRGSDGR